MAQQPGTPDASGGETHVVNLDKRVEPPSYDEIVRWMKADLGQAHVAYDFWARGNYMRRFINVRLDRSNPVMVRVSSIEEVRFAYKRLALLDRPIEFLYDGPDCHPTENNYHPDISLPSNMMIDAGWGYIVAPIKDRKKPSLLGNGEYLPNRVTRWLVTDAKREFENGQVWITPTKAVGLGSQLVDRRYSELAALGRGVPLVDRMDVAVETVLSLDLPQLDQMTEARLRKLLDARPVQAAAFREALASAAANAGGLDEHLERIRQSLPEVSRAANVARIDATWAKAATGATALGIGSLVVAQQASPSALVPAAGAAAALANLWRQAQQSERSLTDHPLFLLWDMGVRKPNQLRKKHLVQRQRLRRAKPSPYHWLCPPTVGARFAFVKKRPGED